VKDSWFEVSPEPNLQTGTPVVSVYNPRGEEVTPMTRLHPACDRHTNLQMIPCSLKRTTGQSHAYVCPVPGCGRHHDDAGYFDVVETRALLKDGIPRNPVDGAARAAITKALDERLRPQTQILPSKQK
jgi:hypothetical protein